MRIVAVCLLAVTLLVLAGCASREAYRGGTQTKTAEPASAPSSTTPSSGATAEKSSEPQDADMKKASLTNAENSQGSVTFTERKIIRNAEMSVETTDPGAGQRRIASIAEGRGGFVVTSESKQRNAEGQMKPEMIVTIQVRVPAAQFDAVLNEIRGSGNRVTQEKITGQDVTEEYIDLEARIRAKQALESQFMEIMKQAKTVQDALEVQRQLSDVRSEIERLEGRRRFLENQSSLSTITVTLEPPTAIVSTTGFFHSVKRAFGEGLDVAASFTLGLISVVVALLPMLIFIVLPIFLLVRYLIRRAGRRTTAFQVPQQAPQPPPSATTT
jgi:hypothetical protein